MMIKIFNSISILEKSNSSKISIGGKGAKLVELLSLSFNVPHFIVVNLNTHSKLEEEWTDHDIFEKITPELLKINPDAKQIKYAVRSSANIEDGTVHSFAGVFDSYLFVDFLDLPFYIKKVIESAGADRVLAYLKQQKIDENIEINVLIQEMVTPDVSGVAFGIHPLTGNTDNKVVTAVYGIGEGLVSGELNADQYTLSDGAWHVEITHKDKKGVRNDSGRIKYVEVEEGLKDKPALNEKLLTELAKALDLLNTHFNSPQDVEFAVVSNQLYFLQTRNVTRVNKIEEKEKPNKIVWDNSNIIESYPGVTSPLTFSYIKSAYANVYMQLARVMGVDEPTIHNNQTLFYNMLGLLQGRVYYNLRSWNQLLSLFPGYQLNAQFMETMMGVKERFELDQKDKPSKSKAVFRTFVMMYSIFVNRLTIKSQTKRFMSIVNSRFEGLHQINLDTLSAFELKAIWEETDAHIVKQWKAPLINDAFAMVYFGKLKKFVEELSLENHNNLHNDLLCGSKDIVSVEPIHESIKIADLVANDEELYQLFTQNDVNTIWNEISKNESLVLTKIQAYLSKFGERCSGELKLETISYKQDPRLFINVIKSLVLQGVNKSFGDKSVDVKLRISAEKIIYQRLKNRPFKKWAFNRLVRKARYFVSNRENLRFERTKAFGITREIFLAIGKDFYRNKIIEHQRDIFFLTKEEIFQFIEGTSVNVQLHELIKLRKKEYQTYHESNSLPERITTFGEVNYPINFTFKFKVAVDHLQTLKGVGCCPGVVRGRVRIVLNPYEVDTLNGDILVTSSTDPGWVTLFPTCSAILVERGSLLSHSAIVSREMGIPCVVGVEHLLTQLSDGDWVELDGSKGTIKILKNER